MLITKDTWLFLPFLLMLPGVYGFFSIESKGDMRPYDPVVEEGDTLVLNCTLTSYYDGTYNSSSIIFKGAYRNYTDFPFVRTLSERTAQLRLPNVTLDMDGIFGCSLPDIRILGQYAFQKVHVARRPLKPYIVDCVVLNWDSMECNWMPNKSVHLDHTLSPGSFRQNLFWSRNGSDWTKCPRTVDENPLQWETCVWPSSEFEMGGVYCVWVNATNVLRRNIFSEIACYDTEKIVRPNSPSDVRLTFEDGEIVVSWQPPSSDLEYSASLLYNMFVYSEWGQEIVFSDMSETTQRFAVVPFTNYILNLSAKATYTSDTIAKSFLTQPTVPCRNPVTNKNAFSFDFKVRKIIFYFQPTEKRDFCGPNLMYHLRMKMKSAENWIDTNSTTTSNNLVLEFGMDVACDVAIVAGNDLGLSKENPNENEIINVPPSNAAISYDVIVEGDGELISIHWFELEETADIIGYTLFWCKSYSRFLHTCQDDIRWKEFNATQNEYNLTLDESYHLFQVGLAVNLPGVSSGIKWSTRIYSMTALGVDRPENLKATVPNIDPPGQLHVSWTLPTETYDKRHGYVRFLTIYYCIVNSQTHCQDSPHSVTVRSYTTSFELSKLDQGTTYKIWMTSHTRTSVSEPTKPIFASTSAAWATTGLIAGIIVGVLFAVVIVVGAIFIMVRYCYKITHNIKIIYPPAAQNHRISNPYFQSGAFPYDCGKTVFYNDYIHQTNQASRFSTMSGDSGNFSLSPTSPTMQPLLPRETKTGGDAILCTTTPLLKSVDDSTIPSVSVGKSNRAGGVLDAELIQSKDTDVDSVSSRKTAFDDTDRTTKTKPEIPGNDVTANYGYYVRPDEIGRIQSGTYRNDARRSSAKSMPACEKVASDGDVFRVALLGIQLDFLPDIGYSKAEYCRPFSENDMSSSSNENEETPSSKSAFEIGDEAAEIRQSVPQDVLNDVRNDELIDGEVYGVVIREDGMVIREDGPFNGPCDGPCDGDGYVQHGLLFNAGVAS